MISTSLIVCRHAAYRAGCGAGGGTLSRTRSGRAMPSRRGGPRRQQQDPTRATADESNGRRPQRPYDARPDDKHNVQTSNADADNSQRRESVTPGQPTASPCVLRNLPATPVRRTNRLKSRDITGTLVPSASIRTGQKSVDVRGGEDHSHLVGGHAECVARMSLRGAGRFDGEAAVGEGKAIADLYRTELRRIAAEMKAAARNLQAGPRGRLSTAGALAVLNEAVDDIDRSLYFEELTAFRDAVRERADELRRKILASSTFASRSDTAAIQLVAQRPETVPAETRSWLYRFADYYLGASEVQLSTEICMVTLPSTACRFAFIRRVRPIRKIRSGPRRAFRSPSAFTPWS